jgi:hypothetical protein
MRKLILMSVIFVSVAVPWRFAGDPRPQRGLKQTVIFMVLFIVAWTIVGTRLFFMAPAPVD